LDNVIQTSKANIAGSVLNSDADSDPISADKLLEKFLNHLSILMKVQE